MKPYKNPRKFVWRCPICFEEKTSGGMGHISSQASAHMKKQHDIYEFAGSYLELGLKCGVMWNRISDEQKSVLETNSRTSKKQTKRTDP